ncbi:MAG TPA: dihydroorotate dehydrogenase electron transfer subunit [Polyangia bacterium]|jgi:dihydroorotate dehydrogenase electron transfer subunit
MEFFEATIKGREDLDPGYFVLRLGGCEALADAAPGQFVMVRGDWGRDPLLPRAVSLLAVGPAGEAALLLKQVGRGTALLGRLAPGTRVRVLGPLGTSFPAPRADRHDLLVAGGCGVPPLYMHAERAVQQGLAGHVELFIGGRGGCDLPLLARFERLGVRVHVATEDGSRGLRGLVTDALQRRLVEVPAGATLLCCGPNAMLEAVARLARAKALPCLVSLEAGMACGLGACLGCAVPGRSRPYLYVCKDGPVFDAEEVYA